MSKNVLLIGPYAGTNGHLDKEAEMYMKKMFVAPPLGLHRIANYLRPEHDVVVYDPNVEGNPYAHLKSMAKGFDIMGFSLTHATLEQDLSLMWMAKEANNGCMIVAGGEEATFNTALIEMYSPVDIIVMGEGERAMKIICDGDVKSGYVVEALGPEGFKEATLGIDSASIPYEEYWSFLEKTNKNFQETRTIRMFTSNYCPWGCAFCSSTNFLNYAYQHRQKLVFIKAEDLLVMILKAVEAHPDVRTIFFQDDNFIGSAGRQRILELCRGILDYKIRGTIPEALSFMCQTRVNDVNEPILELMARAGFRMIGYGVESFSQNMLNEFKKRIITEQINRALNWTYDAGIIPHINIILTSPECNISDIEITAIKCREHLERGAKLGMNLYISPVAGAKGWPGIKDLVESRECKVFGTSLVFSKKERIVPRDERIRKLMSIATRRLGEVVAEAPISATEKSCYDLEAIEYALANGGQK